MEQQSFTTVPRPYDSFIPSPNRSADERRRSPLRGRAAQTTLEEQHRQALGPWFHNINLDGVWTAPDHFLGDYPGAKFRRFAPHLPSRPFRQERARHRLQRRLLLDRDEAPRRDRVLGIDSDERYLAQARLASETLGFDDIEFAKLDVYDVGALGEKFDLVIFMGVLYHLAPPAARARPHPRACRRRPACCSSRCSAGRSTCSPLEDDYEFEETDIFFESGFPKLHFVEQQYSHDWTNWWVPNRACTEAMLRSAGFAIDKQIEEEVYLCRVAERPFAKYGPAAVYPAQEPRA